MTLKDLLRKKDKIKPSSSSSEAPVAESPAEPEKDVPEFTFLRTTTTTQEIITPPHFPGDTPPSARTPEPASKRHGYFHRKLSHHREQQHGGAPGSPGAIEKTEDASPGKRPQAGQRRLSERLHLGSRSRAASQSSVNVPADLPDIGPGGEEGEEAEREWERRATLLAKRGAEVIVDGEVREKEGVGRARSPTVSDKGGDENIQEAIRLHENGELEKSTEIFGRLADPKGGNNALAQVLYGLALRHGWGIPPDASRAITYLSYAASNSAEVEAQALEAGMKKGGAAKGELVLAIFELANCFRHGWGVKKDPVAAKQYYETAANLGDTDAMNEVAWCYLEGFGCKKDKFKAAHYLRLAEERGHKTIGNTWIWKDKYGGPPKKT